MIMDFVLGDPILLRKRGNVCVIAPDEYTDFLFLNELWKQLGWPEDFVFLTRPGIVRVAIQTVHENEVDKSGVGRIGLINLGETEARDCIAC